MVMTRTNRPVLVCRPETGRTVQEETEGTDINVLMRKFRRTGLIPQTQKKPMYGDFSNVLDYTDARQLMNTAQDMFKALPAEIRDRFENKPENLLAFMEDEENYEEAMDLGLVEDTREPEPDPPLPDPKDTSPASVTETE